MLFKMRLWLTAGVMIFSGCGLNDHVSKTNPEISYQVVERQIRVDGDVADWMGVKENTVKGPNHLWFGQGMEPQNWTGDDDLSFGWKAAWYKNRLYFLVRVTDDNVQPCIREYSWLNDCVEIYLDHNNLGGQRIQGVGTSTPIEQRIGKKINGYEMHFLPCVPPRIYLSDVIATYRLENVQNEMFFSEWDGEFIVTQLSNGYMMEIGLSVPEVKLKPGMVMGMDVAVGDDDGNSRKSLMLWTGQKVDFWITMNYFGKIILAQ